MKANEFKIEFDAERGWLFYVQLYFAREFLHSRFAFVQRIGWKIAERAWRRLILSARLCNVRLDGTPGPGSKLFTAENYPKLLKPSDIG